MVKRLFKKSIACLLTVLMIATSLPLTALADSTTDAGTDAVVSRTVKVSSTAVGIITNDGSSRVSTSGSSADYNICNDAQDANFSAAFWKYDTSDIKTLTGTTIKEARFDITLTSTAPLNDFQGYTLYYATNESAVNSLSQGNNKGSDLGGIYTGSNHISNMVSKYGLVSVATFDKATVTANVGGTLTADVSAAMNYAIQNIKDQVTFFLMQSNAGQSGSSNDWSDSHIIADKPDITCTYDETIEVVPGLDGINNAITAYENKMAEVSSSKIYKDMSSVYAVYQKAIKYRDAYQYGGQDAPTVDEVTDVANELVTATENMEVWTDEVTGKFKSVTPTYQSNGGTYSVSSSLQMSDGNPYYSNIIYWETCKGTNNDKSTGDRSGMAIQFDEAGDVQVEVYYPNTVLLYDGTTPARMPVMFMAKSNTKGNNARYIYQVYPAQTNMTDTQWKDSKAGEDPELKSVAQVTGETVDNWKGGDSSSKSLNILDFNAARNNGTNYPSAGIEVKTADNGTVHKSISAKLGTQYATISGNGYWNNYATSFQVTNLNVSASSNKGYKRVGLYWAFYGGSSTTVSQTDVDANIKGYKNSKADNSSGSEKKITVVNYKGLMDALKAVSFNPLTDVSKYKEGGLADLLTAIDNVTAYATYDTIAGITSDTVQNEGKNITDLMKGLSSAKATEDTGSSYYDDLKTAITASKKIYNAGNEDYTKYTQEVWDPFVTAYEAATAYFYALYPDGTLDMSAAQELESNLTTAKNNLKNGMIKKVVETTYLENAISNAEAIIHNSAYFVSSTIDVATLESIVSSAKAEIWGSEDNYGFDTEKIDGTAANQAKVDAYVEQLCAEIKKAQVNVNYVTTTGKSLTTALQAAAVYEDTKANYGNYVVLQTAVNNAENFRDNLPTYDGKVADVVDNSISNYADIVAAVINAINNLQPGFDQLKTGDKASEGKLKKTEFSSSSRSDQWKFYWEYTTDPIIFKTTRDAYTYTFPTSRWGIYNAQTGTDFEMMLDSIKLNSADLQSGEITASSRVQGYGWPTKNYDLSPTQLSDYAAQLAIQSNTRLEITSAKVTKSTGQALGVASALTAAGELDHITDTSHNFVKELEVTDGISGPSRGGIYAKGGWTEFDTTTTLSFPLDQFTLSAKSTPSSMSYDANYKSTYFGVVYFWKYGYMGGTWAGYGFERAPFEEEVYLVNLTPLFELIKQCTAEDFVATEKQYTTSSWQALLTAIADANSSNENSKSDVKFDYGSKTYDDILTAVDKRYTDLWNAYKNLKKAANNTKIKNAVAAAKSAYENDKAKIKESTWDAFEEAYLNATSVISTGAKYSDEKITDVSSNDQSAVDAYATALTEAFNALVYQIDFTPVDNAVTALIDSVESNKYSAESVKAVKAGIENLSYYMMSASDRKNHYTDETDVVAAVKKEAEETIPALKSLLKESTVDTSVLEAAKAENKAKLSDPDAYDQDAVNTALAALTETENVILGTSRIVCKKFATQAECDQAIKDALDGIQLRNYTVKIVPDGDESKATTQTVPYGTQYTASLDGKPTVDWYYEMTSPSTSVAKKFYSTTDELEFIVRGDTTLTTKSASKTAQQYKVTYINGMNSAPVSVEYVSAGKLITLGTNSDGQDVVPELAYYEYSSLDVNGESMNKGDSFTVNKDTIITVRYKVKEDEAKTYTVRIVNLDGHLDGESNVIDLSDLKYNDELSFKAGTEGYDNTEGYGGANMNYDVTKYDDSTKSYVTETVSKTDMGRWNISIMGDEGASEDVYAWLELDLNQYDEDDETKPKLSDWWTKANDFDSETCLSKLYTMDDTGANHFTDYAKANTKARVVKYGQDYTFRVHEDTYLLPVTKTEYDEALAAGMILTDETDENGVRIKTQSELVIAVGKASIVSTFALPEDCTLVEKGILVKVNKDSLIDDTSDFKLANVGQNGLKRLKSNYTTAGDQFVISFNTSALDGKNISDVGLAWVAYITYKTSDGQLVTQYSPVTTPTNEGTY